MTQAELDAYWEYELRVIKPFWDAVHAGVRRLLEEEAKQVCACGEIHRF